MGAAKGATFNLWTPPKARGFTPRITQPCKLGHILMVMDDYMNTKTHTNIHTSTSNHCINQSHVLALK